MSGSFAFWELPFVPLSIILTNALLLQATVPKWPLHESLYLLHILNFCLLQTLDGSNSQLYLTHAHSQLVLILYFLPHTLLLSPNTNLHLVLHLRTKHRN